MWTIIHGCIISIYPSRYYLSLNCKCSISCNVLFIRLNLLKFYDYIECKTIVIMYRVRFGLVPKNIISFFYVGEDNRYETRQRGNFVQWYIRTTMRANWAMCLSVVGVQLWNNLSVSQKNCCSVYNFKKMLKSIIIDRYVINEAN